MPYRLYGFSYVANCGGIYTRGNSLLLGKNQYKQCQCLRHCCYVASDIIFLWIGILHVVQIYTARCFWYYIFMNRHITCSTNLYRALFLLLPVTVHYEMFGPLPLTFQCKASLWTQSNLWSWIRLYASQ